MSDSKKCHVCGWYEGSPTWSPAIAVCISSGGHSYYVTRPDLSPQEAEDLWFILYSLTTNNHVGQIALDSDQVMSSLLSIRKKIDPQEDNTDIEEDDL